MITNGPIIIKAVDNANTIAIGAGAVGYSGAYILVDLSVFALEYKIACTGVPNVKLEMQQSSDATNWYTPDTMSNIASSVTDTNQHGVQLGPITVKWLRIKATEVTGVVTDTVVTVNLSAQKRFAA